MKVFKYPIPPISDLLIEMPKGASVLCVQRQRNEAMLWAEVNPSAPIIKRRFKMRGTGHDLPEDARHYVGTAVMLDGEFVLHVYTDGIEYPMDYYPQVNGVGDAMGLMVCNLAIISPLDGALIAAAPDLLAALKECAPALARFGFDSETVRKANEAIAKAESSDSPKEAR